METKRIIEVNGVKMELDARTAAIQNVDTYRVGDNVTLLLTENSYGSPKRTKALSGVIVDFANFTGNPTIVVCYLDDSYPIELKMAYINKENAENQIVHAERGSFDAGAGLLKLEKMVGEAEAKLLIAKRNYETFKKYFYLAQKGEEIND